MNKKRGPTRRPAKSSTDHVMWSLLEAARAVEAELEGALADVQLSGAKLAALTHLVEAGEPVSLGELAERCACVRSNITQLVDRLEAEGLVARVDDPRDRRSIRAELTAEGRRRQAAGVRALEAAEKDLLAHLPPAHRGAFRELLTALRAAC